jgi:hypothetical protein
MPGPVLRTDRYCLTAESDSISIRPGAVIGPIGDEDGICVVRIVDSGLDIVEISRAVIVNGNYSRITDGKRRETG